MKSKIANMGLAASILLMIQMPCQAASWPDSPEKQKILKNCAEFLLLSVDTNQIELVCSKIRTNLPTVIRLENRATQNGPIAVTFVTNEDLVSQIKDFSSRVRFNLIMCADQLTASNINAYSSEAGYCATASNPQGSIFYNLWFNNGPLRYLNTRSESGQIVMSARFYQNGKLEYFNENISQDEGFVFDANGKLNSYAWTTTNKVEVDVNFDDVGNVKIRGFNLNK